MRAIGKVGKRGELYPPKKIRDAVGLAPGRKVLYIVKDNKIEVILLKSFKEALEEKPLVRISIEEFEKLTKEVLGELQ
ncbi:MAG: AbrB/MazE/SpoVT family DNA-binding domain-containing protein [Candidatus Njordarchaeales archaeon]